MESVQANGAPPVLLVESSLCAPADGLELCRTLRASKAPTWLIFIAPPEAVELRLEAFRAGVDDCASRALDSREIDALLTARLKHLERTRSHPPPAPLEEAGVLGDARAHLALLQRRLAPGKVSVARAFSVA